MSGGAAATGAARADQDFGGNAEALMQAADHFERERTLAVHHFVHAAAASDDSDEGARIESLLLEPEANRLDRIGRVDRKVYALVGFDQRRAHVQPVALGSSLPSPHRRSISRSVRS